MMLERRRQPQTWGGERRFFLPSRPVDPLIRSLHRVNVAASIQACRLIPACCGICVCNAAHIGEFEFAEFEIPAPTVQPTSANFAGSHSSAANH